MDAAAIRRAARDMADGLTLETRAYRMGFDRGFRTPLSMESGDHMTAADHADYRRGHAAGAAERAEYDALARLEPAS